MITATLVGTVWEVRPIGENRSAVRFRVRYPRYNKEQQAREWQSLYTTAFVPAALTANLAQGDSITVVADIVPDIFRDQATLRIERVHQFVRNLSRAATESAASAAEEQVSPVESLLDEGYDPFAED